MTSLTASRFISLNIGSSADPISLKILKPRKRSKSEKVVSSDSSRVELIEADGLGGSYAANKLLILLALMTSHTNYLLDQLRGESEPSGRVVILSRFCIISSNCSASDVISGYSTGYL